MSERDLVERVSRAIVSYSILSKHDIVGGGLRHANHEFSVYRTWEATDAGVPDRAILSRHEDKREARRECARLNARAAVTAVLEVVVNLSHDDIEALCEDLTLKKDSDG